MNKLIDLTGQTFGRLTVINRANINTIENKPYWNCCCKCGKITVVRGSDLRRGSTESCGCLQKERSAKHAKEQKGINHYRYRHDLSDKDRLISKDRRLVGPYKSWCKFVYKRDNYTCQQCFKIGGKLCAHHIYNWADYPELRFDLDNGITLCNTCHKLFHHLYGIKNNNLIQLNEFRS